MEFECDRIGWLRDNGTGGEFLGVGGRVQRQEKRKHRTSNAEPKRMKRSANIEHSTPNFERRTEEEKEKHEHRTFNAEL